MSDTELSKSAFMGKITAGATHEMKNVLAIIRESAGLMEDLLGASREDSLPIREKFLKILSGIGNQVTRGVNLANALNRFSHNPDEPIATVDVDHLIGELIVLCQRFALSKKVILKNVAHEQPLHYRCDPVKFQMTIYRGIELLLGTAAPGTTITIRAMARSSGNPAVEFLCEGNSIELDDIPQSVKELLWDPMVSCAESMNAKVETGYPPICFAMVFKEAVKSENGTLLSEKH